MAKRREFIQSVGAAGIGSLLPIGVLAGGPGPVALVVPPPKNFSSNHNYFIYAGGNPMTDVVVTVETTEEILALNGMSMQLNCYSPANADCVWQQYVTGFGPTTSSTLSIGASIENFPSKAYRAHLHETIGLHPKGDIISEHLGHFGTFPGPSDRIPAGYKIKYELLTDQSSGAVIGAQFSVTDEQGRTKSTGPHYLRTLNFDGTSTRVTPSAMAPVLALQMNLVGISGGRYMLLNSGAGTITYEAAVPLTPQGRQPSTTASQGVFTAERSNVTYGELRNGMLPVRKIVQTFQASPVPHYFSPPPQTVVTPKP